jgi:hypothetical protein
MMRSKPDAVREADLAGHADMGLQIKETQQQARSRSLAGCFQGCREETASIMGEGGKDGRLFLRKELPVSALNWTGSGILASSPR